jgi:hypothetical protein
MAGIDIFRRLSRINRIAIAAALFAATVFIGGPQMALAQTAVPPDQEYEFVSDPGIRINYEWGNVVRVLVIDAKGGVRTEKEVDALHAFGTIGRSPVGTVIKIEKPFKAYEYRSGRLILGSMTMTGDFVPEAGSTVRKFEDYKFGRDPWIWNLPGYFRPKEKVGADKEKEK